MPVKGSVGDDGVQSTGEAEKGKVSYKQASWPLEIIHPVRTDPAAMRIGALTLGTSGTMAT